MTTAATHADVRQPRALVVVGVVTAGAMAFNVARRATGLDHRSLGPSVAAFLALTVAGGLLAVALNDDRRRLGLVLPRSVPMVVGSTLGIGATVGMAVATSTGAHLPTGRHLAGGLALFALCTAPAEELLFRGILYGAVEERHGPIAATAVSAVAFAAVHVPSYGFSSLPIATCAGLLLGWLRWWSGSLAPPWLVHTVADCALLWL